MTTRAFSPVCGWVFSWLCGLWLSTGCGSSGLQRAPQAAHLPQPAASDASEGSKPALSGLTTWNAQARSGAVTELVGGQQVSDPYRSLELETSQTQAWLQAQTERTEQALAAAADPQTEARLARLLEIGSLGEVDIADKRLFFLLREAPRERPALYMLDPAAPLTPSALRAAPPLIDPQDFGARASIDYFAPSHTGHHVAFGISDNGDERATLRVYAVEQRKLTADEIPHAKWSSVEWLNDDSGFYYRRYPLPGEEHWDAERPDSYYSNLFVHRLGQPATEDALVFQGEKPVDFPSATLDDSERYLLITNQRSWTANDLWLWDRGARKDGRALAPKREQLQAILQGTDSLASGDILRGQLYLTTNVDAPKQRVIKVDTAHAADHSRWKTIIPETDATIESALITAHFIVVNRMRELHSTLELYSQEGAPLGELALPGIGSLGALAGSQQHDRIAVTWSSPLHAPQLLYYDLAHRAPRALYQVQQDFPADDYELSRASVPSADGTPINVFYAQRKGRAKDGETPVLLTGYGGFDVALLPTFSRSALYFLEQGGIFAQANLRGGGEFGESWHRAGMLKNKHHVFEDFEAAVRWFTQSGLSNPKKIAITGGSNGGLLMGAMITRAPDSFAAAASYVGLYDMLRYAKFPPAELWTSEYGDPDDPECAAYLLSYSPYHRVRDGVAYPAALIETADHDTRVFWGHSAKFAARLQAATSSQNPIYFYLERAVGHGRGIGTADLVRRYARQYAFLRSVLGMPLRQ